MQTSSLWKNKYTKKFQKNINKKVGLLITKNYFQYSIQKQNTSLYKYQIDDIPVTYFWNIKLYEKKVNILNVKYSNQVSKTLLSDVVVYKVLLNNNLKWKFIYQNVWWKYFYSNKFRAWKFDKQFWKKLIKSSEIQWL